MIKGNGAADWRQSFLECIFLLAHFTTDWGHEFVWNLSTALWLQHGGQSQGDSSWVTKAFHTFLNSQWEGEQNNMLIAFYRNLGGIKGWILIVFLQEELHQEAFLTGEKKR